MSIGLGTNTFVELLTLWGLLWFSRKRGIFDLRIVGDSKVVSDWIDDKNSMQSLSLSY